MQDDLCSSTLLHSATFDCLIADWFETYQAPLFRYLVQLVGEEQHAADLLQDTFLRALAALSKQAPPDNPFAWLHRIATNLAYNALRRRNRWRWLPLGTWESVPAFENAVADIQIIRRCLARLRQQEAEALLLYEVVGLTSGEIATLTGEQAATIRVRIRRARKRFCELYTQEGNDGLS